MAGCSHLSNLNELNWVNKNQKIDMVNVPDTNFTVH